jgi:DNA-binding response OmpR family regulator
VTAKHCFPHIWGDNYYGDDKIVDVNIRRIRMKIEDEPSNPRYISTIWGYGYKWSVKA